MIDTLHANRERASKSNILDHLGIYRKEYVTITLHRPSNVDNEEVLSELVQAFDYIRKVSTIVFPIHPRTRNNMRSMGMLQVLERMENVMLIEPVGYIDFLKFLSDSQVVMTDSGGIQEETTILGVPCLTLRDNTERPVTLTQGTNRLDKQNREDIITAFNDCKINVDIQMAVPELWDGGAAKRIVEIISKLYL